MRRDLRLFYLYRLLTTSFLFLPAQMKFLNQERGLSWTQIALLNSVFNAVLILFEVPTGALADRIGRRWAMVLGSSAMSLACAIYYANGTGTFTVFIVAEIIFALGMTLTSGPDSAYLFDLLNDKGEAARYSAVEGTASSFKYIGMALACLLGGFIGQRDAAMSYLCAAVVCGVSAAVAACLREAPPAHRMREQRWGGYVPHVFSAVRTALRGKRLRYAILYSSLIFVLLRVSLWLYQPYLHEAGFDVAAIGVIFAALYAVAALCAHFVQRIRARFQQGTIYWLLPAVLGVSYLVLGPAAGAFGIALMIAQKAVDGVYSPLTKELLNREIRDSAQRASVLSVESMTRRVFFALFSPLCGILMDGFGRGAAFYLCALVGGLGAGALLLRGRTKRLLPLPDAAASEEPALTGEAAPGRFTPS